MQQLILRFTKFVLALLTASMATSCIKYEIGTGFRTITGSKNVITEKRNVTSDFNKIHSSTVIDVVVEQAPTHEIVVKADDNLIEFLTTEIENNTLKIYFDDVSIRNFKEAKVYVKLPEISELKASSSSEINAVGTIVSESLTLKSSSTAKITLNKVRANDVDIKASSSSDIKVKEIYAVNLQAKTSSTADFEAYIEADNISLEASSSSDMDIKGKALELFAKTSSTATIDAKELFANNVTATSSSSSSIKTYPIVSLKAKASSTASIHYYNDPQNLEKETSSTGSVKKNK